MCYYESVGSSWLRDQGALSFSKVVLGKYWVTLCLARAVRKFLPVGVLDPPFARGRQAVILPARKRHLILVSRAIFKCHFLIEMSIKLSWL